MAKANKSPLHLIVKNGSKQTVYIIDNYRSISIQYHELYNDYLISFKQYNKQMLVSCKWFNITGKVYTSYE